MPHNNIILYITALYIGVSGNFTNFEETLQFMQIYRLPVTATACKIWKTTRNSPAIWYNL